MIVLDTAIETSGWEVQRFPSGTQIIKCRDMSPHYYVYGPAHPNESHADRDRAKVCDDLREYLNGGKRPLWLDDLKRISDGCMQDLDGTCIIATGPSYDADPPHLNWREDNSIEAKRARKLLIDRLCGFA